MNEIREVAVIGLGALGIMYGKHLMDHGAQEHLSIIVDKERLERYEREGVFCNDEVCSFHYVIPEKCKNTVDLLLIAVKFNGLEQALKDAAPFVDENTIIMSLLNGISSEEIIKERFGSEKVVYCVALGMDAMKLGNQMHYTNKGLLAFGTFDQYEKNPKISAVASYFDRMEIPYRIDNNMKYQLWSKFMVNVGVNQTTMVYETNYAGIHKDGEARQTMIAAMREVMELSKAEGINLTDEDLHYWLEVLDGLDPEGMPSMRQDSVRGQKSEVELFSGTCIALGNKHGISVPVNEYLYQQIRTMENNI
ncbi:ketopantoate reductase family protein [Alkalibacter rhizosphaerae]|uniref:2-dehydropantoate 2-reductase n=1 Tax=Alkalibacter rhizosphaerae TaxID=2815577 RepID=A0A974XF69_9FIRM|nr:ketopantoate reductase family protein [Alkalibacter rhizosphaerae]QSX08586.1 ketopantoate reductase family protein [Alkalibacter rhizosphaerae]